MSGPRRWSAAEDARLADRYAAGVSVVDIAAELGRTPDSVTARRRALAIPVRRDGWTAAEDRLLAAGTAAGHSVAGLAARLGRSPEAVRYRRRRLGLGEPRTPGRFAAHEDARLRAAWVGVVDLPALAAELGRSPESIRRRATRLGLRSPGEHRRWTEAEDDLLRDGYSSGRSLEDILLDLPGRTRGSAEARAAKLAIIEAGRVWSAAEDRALTRMVREQMTMDAVAHGLRRSPEAVRARCRRLGVRRPARGAPSSPGPWSPAEDAVLRAWADAPVARLALMLGRSEAAVRRRLARIGVPAGSPMAGVGGRSERGAHRAIADETAARY